MIRNPRRAASNPVNNNRKGDHMTESRTAVIAVDIQADFTEARNGSLAVPGTKADYLDVVIRRTAILKGRSLPIIATRDFHPADHVSFHTSHVGLDPFSLARLGEREQMIWPPHCVQGTPGAEILIPNFYVDHFIDKGRRRKFDSYSGFRDDGGAETRLNGVLKDLGVERLLVFGLATDYCVKATVLHGLEAGFDVTLVESLCRGVAPETTAAALKEMRSAGAAIREDIS
jgi:nicotinamidase/pyrazinamidase